MRFIRQEHLITTICNKKITDIDVVKTLLLNLKKESIEFSLIIKKESQNNYYDQNFSYKNVKIRKIDNTTVDFMIFNKSTITNLKEININNILEISAITKKNRILDYKSNVSRHELLDIEEDD